VRGSGHKGGFDDKNGESLGSQEFSNKVSTRKMRKKGHKEVNLT